MKLISLNFQSFVDQKVVLALPFFFENKIVRNHVINRHRHKYTDGGCQAHWCDSFVSLILRIDCQGRPDKDQRINWVPTPEEHRDVYAGSDEYHHCTPGGGANSPSTPFVRVQRNCNVDDTRYGHPRCVNAECNVDEDVIIDIMKIVWLEGPGEVQNHEIGCKHSKNQEAADRKPESRVPAPS